MMNITCHSCGSVRSKKLHEAQPKGRPWKHSFCDRRCYDRWRADQHNALKRRSLLMRRSVWGTTEAGRFDIGGARVHGRRAEILARDKILPVLGFTEIDDMSGYSNQFFVDFVANYEDRRVLVDATIKLKAYVPEKVRMASAMRMPLFILHVGIKADDIYWLNSMAKGVVSRVPAAYLNRLADR